MKKYYLFITILISSILLSCRTIQQTTDHNHQKDSIQIHYITKLDSIYIYEKDSIFIHQKNDTIFYNKYITRYKDKIINIHDSIYIDKLITDSIYINKTTQVKYVPNFYKYSTISLYIILFLILLYIIWLVIKKFYLHK